MKLRNKLFFPVLGAATVALVIAVPSPGADARAAEPRRDAAQVAEMRNMLNLMQQFFGIIESVHGIASDPKKAAILQMFEIEEIYKQRGERARAVDVFRTVLKETTDPTVRNATTMMLSDALKETGQADEAVAVLKDALMSNLRK